jgi:hypothetical protein
MTLLPYQPLQSFSLLSYPNNPSWYQPGQTIDISPAPGFSASSYSITSGSLPLGYVFNSVTGVFTGTATTLTTDPVVLQVTATLADTTTTTCQLSLNVSDIPATAQLSNQASSFSLTDNRQLAEARFLASAEQIFANNQQLGMYWAYLELPEYVSFRFVWFYFTRLHYVVENLNPAQNDYIFSSFFGEFPSFPGYYDNYFDFTQPFPATVKSHPVRRVRISWSPRVGNCFSFPWLPYYPIPFNGV